MTGRISRHSRRCAVSSTRGGLRLRQPKRFGAGQFPLSWILAAVHQAPTEPVGSEPETCRRLFLSSATQLDTVGIEASLDAGFALGSFELVVDSWLFPTLVALGEGWAAGEIDVAGEHAASHAVHRRLSAAFEAAGSGSRGPTVVVGLPSGSQHELGALAFATAIRRRGMNVVYLGANVPLNSWETAVRSRGARVAALSVVTPEDRRPAQAVAERLLTHDVAPLVCSGGASGANLAAGVQTLGESIGTAALELDALTHEAS